MIMRGSWLDIKGWELRGSHTCMLYISELMFALKIECVDCNAFVTKGVRMPPVTPAN